MADFALTVDEIIGTIERSSLISVLVEGQTDMIAYRAVEEAFSDDFLTLFEVGGREPLIEVFSRLQGTPHLNKCVFICDKDLWLYTGIPADYLHSRIVTTDGYSIENDLLRDYNAVGLMTRREKLVFEVEQEKFIRWFSYAVHQHRLGDAIAYQSHPNRVLDNGLHSTQIDQSLKDRTYPFDFEKEISSDPLQKVRGKSLLALILRQLSKKGRNPKHSALSILEIAVAARGTHLARIVSDVGKALT